MCTYGYDLPVLISNANTLKSSYKAYKIFCVYTYSLIYILKKIGWIVDSEVMALENVDLRGVYSRCILAALKTFLYIQHFSLSIYVPGPLKIVNIHTTCNNSVLLLGEHADSHYREIHFFLSLCCLLSFLNVSKMGSGKDPKGKREQIPNECTHTHLSVMRWLRWVTTNH